MVETVTFSELEENLEFIPPEVAVLLVGPAGIGKSSFAKAWAAHQEGYRYYEKNVAEVLDIGDFLGRNSVVDGRTVLNPPPWFSDTEKTILFIDEINRAGANSIVRGCMGLVLNRAIAELKMPEGSRILSAANPDMGPMYDIIPFDLAQSDRFYVAEVMCDAQYWLNRIAGPQHFNSAVVEFIRKYPDYLHQLSNPKLANDAMTREHYRNVLSTPRSWDMFSRSLNNMERKMGEGNPPTRRRLETLGAGFVGPLLATSFATFYLDMKVLSKIDVIEVLTQANMSIEEHDKAMKVLEEIVKTDPTRAIGMLTDIHSYLLHEGATVLKKKIALAAIAENYYTIMSMCSAELRQLVFTNHLTPLAGQKGCYIDRIRSVKPEVEDLFDTKKTVLPKSRAGVLPIQTQWANPTNQEFDNLADAWSKPGSGVSGPFTVTPSSNPDAQRLLNSLKTQMQYNSAKVDNIATTLTDTDLIDLSPASDGSRTA
jgi:hypothetical protein